MEMANARQTVELERTAFIFSSVSLTKTQECQGERGPGLLQMLVVHLVKALNCDGIDVESCDSRFNLGSSRAKWVGWMQNRSTHTSERVVAK